MYVGNDTKNFTISSSADHGEMLYRIRSAERVSKRLNNQHLTTLQEQGQLY
jgi:hypothetical protein